MKNIILFLLFLLAFRGNSQQTTQQLSQKIKSLPSNQNVVIESYEDDQTKNVKSVKAGSFTLPNNINKPTVLKYDKSIHNITEIDKRKFVNMLEGQSLENNTKVIPEYYIDIPANPDDQGGTQLIFTPIVTNSKPLTFDPEHGYKANLNFILFCESDSEGQSISNPVHLEISSSHLDAIPSQIVIDHVNLPSTEVKVFTKDVNDSVDIRIITNSNAPDGYAYYMKVNPVLELNTNNTSIQGLGIQETPIIVSFRGSSSNKEELVTVTTSSGYIEPSSFQLTYNGTKTINLRSEGLEDIRITASSTSSSFPINDSNTLIVEQKFPNMFLLFALIGGLLGALIRFGFGGSKKYPFRMMMGGILMGILGAIVYYVLGINFLKFQVSTVFNEFAVLGFSALCSLLLKPSLLGVRPE